MSCSTARRYMKILLLLLYQWINLMISFNDKKMFSSKVIFSIDTHTQYSETLEFNAYSEFDSKSSAKRNRILNFFKIFMIRFGRIELTIYPIKDSKFVWQKFSLAFGLVLFASVRFYFELVRIRFESFTVLILK